MLYYNILAANVNRVVPQTVIKILFVKCDVLK